MPVFTQADMRCVASAVQKCNVWLHDFCSTMPPNMAVTLVCSLSGSRPHSVGQKHTVKTT